MDDSVGMNCAFPVANPSSKLPGIISDSVLRRPRTNQERGVQRARRGEESERRDDSIRSLVLASRRPRARRDRTERVHARRHPREFVHAPHERPRARDDDAVATIFSRRRHRASRRASTTRGARRRRRHRARGRRHRRHRARQHWRRVRPRVTRPRSRAIGDDDEAIGNDHDTRRKKNTKKTSSLRSRVSSRADEAPHCHYR